MIHQNRLPIILKIKSYNPDDERGVCWWENLLEFKIEEKNLFFIDNCIETVERHTNRV